MKKIYVLLIFTVISWSATAQLFPGYNTSNYAGINAVDANPANVVDSRYVFDMNLIAANVILENNYIGVNTSQVRNKQIWKGTFKDYTAFQNANLYERSLGSNNFSFYTDEKIQGPSALLSITHNFAVGISSEVRSIFNLDGVDPNLAKLSYYQLEYPSLYHQTFTSKNFSLRQMSWADVGVDIGRVVIDRGSSFLKVGVKVKYIQALNSLYLRANNMTYEFNNDHILNMNNPGTDFQYSHSEGFDPGGSMNSVSDYLKFNSKPTLGLDIGAVYEYRPNSEKYKYNMDGKTRLYRDDKNKYKWKVGASLTDIGWVKFDRPGNVNDFTANLVNFDINKFSPSGVGAFDDSLKNDNVKFTTKNSKNSYRVELPMALSFQFDYNIYKNFYANATYLGDMTVANTDPAHVHQVSYVMITPRWDWKWAGVFIPVTYDGYHNLNTGLSVRVGPIIVGSGSILNVLTKKHVYGTDFHIAVKIPILYGRPHDRDHDGVSDRKDKCPRDSGSWSTHGCPDADGDGIADKDDSCPHEAGPIATHGCPDKDGDGVADKDDKCPNVTGSPEHHGCPDTDGDGVYDDVDKCPLVKGSPDNFGCPVELVKPVVKDTVKAVQPAPIIEKAPIVEKKAELVTEKKQETKVETKVETKPAPVAENVPNAFADIHFDLAKSTLSPAADVELDQLAALLKKHSTWQVNLSGYADNTGTIALNRVVSQNRTMAVRQFLLNKGANAAQIKTEWHGQDNPVGDNSTEAGRAQNRRVEVKLIQK